MATEITATPDGATAEPTAELTEEAKLAAVAATEASSTATAAETVTESRPSQLKVSIDRVEGRQVLCVIVQTDDPNIKLPAAGSILKQLVPGLSKMPNVNFVEIEGDEDDGFVRRTKKAASGAGEYHYEKVVLYSSEPEKKERSGGSRQTVPDEQKDFMKALVEMRKLMKAGQSEKAAWIAAAKDIAKLDEGDALLMFKLLNRREPKDS